MAGVLRHYKKCFALLIVIGSVCQAQKKTISQKVDSVIRLMTLDEKIGQLNQYNGDWESTGPITKDGDKQNQIRKGMVGSMINVTGVLHTRQLQSIAMESRLKIPLLFGQDIIHGYRTTFPIPLAEACSWDLEAIANSARIAAIESAAAGMHWTFAPMVDIARDPRWGRVMEGAGEDPFLGSLIAAARVKGFQGKGLGHIDALMACAKHFAAYGAAVGGRDYNSVDMSNVMLWETYLPPFKAAADAGVATFMNSFNDLNGIPATANAYLQKTILKGKWNYSGFVVSDWGSIGEMIKHGYVKDNAEAAIAALTAGCDMDMESRSFISSLAAIVSRGTVKIGVVDDAVRRILTKKFELGLFDDPFRFCDAAREQQQWNNPDHLKAATKIAEKSIVLLKNNNNALPLSRTLRSIACIGPLMKNVRDNLGFWSYQWPDDSDRIVTQWNGITKHLNESTVMYYAKGCNITDTSTAGFQEAVELALRSDVVIVSVGETGDMSGEAKSRSDIHLPGVQEQLVTALVATGKPVVVLINAGRPLIFDRIAEKATAILYTWWLGTTAGDAIGNVLFGDYNPSAKLPITFPRSEGQIPIYYDHLSTGRPPDNDSIPFYRSGYIDLPATPQYPFGFGLSYTKFEYSNLSLNKNIIKPNEQARINVSISNTGNFDGEETVQLYICDLVASIVQPVKKLKAFQKIFLKKGEKRDLTFVINLEDLKFYNKDLNRVAEPGEFIVYVGTDSHNVKEAKFTLLP